MGFPSNRRSKTLPDPASVQVHVSASPSMQTDLTQSLPPLCFPTLNIDRCLAGCPACAQHWATGEEEKGKQCSHCLPLQELQLLGKAGSMTSQVCEHKPWSTHVRQGRGVWFSLGSRNRHHGKGGLWADTGRMSSDQEEHRGNSKVPRKGRKGWPEKLTLTHLVK